jgi:hypothetical protein
MDEAGLVGRPSSVPSAGRVGFRLRIGDLLVWTLGCGVIAAVCRGVKPRSWVGTPVDIDPLLGVIAVVLAVGLGLVLVRQAVELVRGRLGRDVPVIAAVAWRLAAATVLGIFLVAEEAELSAEFDRARWLRQPVGRNLLPVVATLGMAGIVAGMTRGRVRATRWPSLSTLGATAVGVAFMATESIIPYLVLIAIEAVTCAMIHPDRARLARADLSDRITRAGLESIVPLVCCALLGLCLSRALRRPATEPGRARRRALVLAVATLLAAAGSAWTVGVIVPELHICLVEGGGSILTPGVVAAVFLGFAGLALGLAARAADRPGADEAVSPRPRTWQPAVMHLAQGILALILLDVIAVRVAGILGWHEAAWARWVGWFETALAWVQSLLPLWLSKLWIIFAMPQWSVTFLAQLWLAWQVGRFVLRPGDRASIPIDASLRDPRAAARLAGRWAALMVLMVASLPVLTVAGLGLLHCFLAP